MRALQSLQVNTPPLSSHVGKVVMHHPSQPLVTHRTVKLSAARCGRCTTSEKLQYEPSSHGNCFSWCHSRRNVGVIAHISRRGSSKTTYKRPQVFFCSVVLLAGMPSHIVAKAFEVTRAIVRLLLSICV